MDWFYISHGQYNVYRHQRRAGGDWLGTNHWEARSPQESDDLGGRRAVIFFIIYSRAPYSSGIRHGWS